MTAGHATKSAIITGLNRQVEVITSGGHLFDRVDYLYIEVARMTGDEANSLQRFNLTGIADDITQMDLGI